jgi:fibronectin type 3 domain-containing protein
MARISACGWQKIVGIFVVLLLSFIPGCGGSGSGGGGKGNPPATPTGLRATAGNQQVMLSWNASSGATSYNVQRSTTSGGSYTTIASPVTTTYTDTGLTNGTTYYYVVSAVNTAGQSANSTQVSATPKSAPPPVPTGLIATAGNQQIILQWNASSGATGYNLQRSTTSGGPYTSVASPTTTSYTDTGLTNGTPYYYVVASVDAAGQSSNSTEASATPAPPPPAPTNLTATAGNAQVSLSWTASTGAASYNVKRGTASGGPYTTIHSPTTTSYTDTSVTNGTAYYYVVTAVNAAGEESSNSNQVTATPVAAGTSVSVSIDVLTNRHSISPYIYGGAFPASTAAITDSGTTVVRWGGNASSTYNYQLGTYNADNDYYFEDFNFCGLSGSTCDGNSTQWISDVQGAGSHPLMTMVMMNWVAQSAEASGNGHWSFSVAKYGAQCATDPYNSDAGDGIKAGTCTASTPTYLTANPNDAYYPLLDDSSESCPSWATDGCVNALYRNTWASALATAFGNSSTCSIPYFSALTSCHFYDMDNEIDIWGSTHFDIHPNPSGYDELASVYLTEANNLKGWDPLAVRLGPVSCCWWFYWNGANSSDKGAHAGIDFLPWWLNQVYWQDQIAGARSLDIFDIHAYPDGPDMTNFTTAQKQAAAVSIYRDYWDPTLVSPSGTINQTYTTYIQPNKTIAFRIPRMRAIANMIYPGTPLSFTEWSAAFAGESDFSTALGDADAYGILGRERVSLATRWEAPSSANPNYQALKLYTNYDGAHHGFETISVSDTNNGNPNLFSSYASLDPTGKTMTVVVLNKDPQNTAQVQFAFNGYTPTSFISYSFSSAAPSAITASSSQSWNATMNFAPYSATLLVITGSSTNTPASEWDLDPDTIMVPAGGTVTLSPKIVSGTANVTLSSAAFDSFEGVSACSGTITLTSSTITPSENGTITVDAGTTPGFCHFTATGSDGTVTQNQGGWIVVGNPPASFSATSGGGQSGTGGSTLPNPLTVTLNPGQSGGSANGASIFFTTNAGTLSNGTSSGPKVIAVTNSSGIASVTLTLPTTAGQVQVQAEGPYGLGHPVANFTETAQ